MDITLGEIAEKMREYNRDVAPGSECNAWQDFVDDCHTELGVGPWPDHYGRIAQSLFIDYWTDVVSGVSDEYDGPTGSRIGV